MGSLSRDQQIHIDTIRQANIARLQELDLQIAQQGWRVDPAVRNEAEQLRANLGAANAVSDPNVTDDMLQALGKFAQRRATDSVVLQLQLDMRTVLSRLDWLPLIALGDVLSLLIGLIALVLAIVVAVKVF